MPSGYEIATPIPLVILLHGYGATGALQESLFKLEPVAEAQTFLYAYPDGTPDSSGLRFWNATDACCDRDHTGVDDVAYVNAIIDDVQSTYSVDPKRIFVTGHSNGGFMVYRLACDLSSRVAAVVSLAGAVWNDPTKCSAPNPVAIVEIHGDADKTINYNGGAIDATMTTQGHVYPSAHQTVATWASKRHCTGPLAPTGRTIDLDSVLPGEETTVEAYSGCPTGVVELWTIHGAGHLPALQPNWASTIYDFMSAHPQP